MLQVVILLHILCFVPGDAFPQRTNPHDQSNFDFDAYLKHFAPTKQIVLDHPRSFPNQDYRYIPLLGERPDYIPPIIQRGHFPHPNIPKRVVKHRSWHSTYQNSNFPTRVFQQPPKNFGRHRPIQSHGEMHRPAPQFSVPDSNFNFRIHSKMEDLGDYEAPVVVEEIKKEPVTPQQNEDYDFPVVLESIDKKHTADSLKHKNHKTEIVVVPPTDIATFKDYVAKSPNFIKPSLDEEYDAPVVVESLIKVGHSKLNEDHPRTSHSDFSEDYEEPIVLQALTKVKNPVHKKNGHHKQTKVGPVKNKIVKIHPIMKPDVKPVKKTSVYLEDYEAPEVVQEFTKEELTRSQGKVGHKVKEHTLEKEDVKVSIVNPAALVYSDEAPIVVAAFTKDELDHSKGHVAHPVKEPSDKQTQPIVKKSPGYSEDYEAPVVLEAFTKDELSHHTKKNKLTVKEKPFAKQDKVKIDYSSEKASVPGYTEDYEAPIVVEALTKEESFHKENGMKTVTKHQNSKSKDDHKEVESTEDYKTEEYDYKELESYLLNEDADYQNLDTRNEMYNDLDDYNYEDVTEESLVPVHQSGMKHSQKSATKTAPVKTRPEVNDNDEIFSKVPAVKGDGYKASLEAPKSNMRVKREAIDDFEFPEIKEFEKDYEVPVIVETIKREKFVSKRPHSNPNSEVAHKPNFVEPSPDEDYEYPVIVEELSKGEVPSDMESQFVSKPAHFKPNTGILIGNKPPNFVQPSPDEDYESPVIVETISKVNRPSGEKAEKIPSKVHAHSKPNQGIGTIHKPIFVEQSQNEDYELPKIVETISKVTEPTDERIPAKVKPQINKDYETVIEALTKADGSIQNPAEHIKDDSNAYSRNKREREYSMGYHYPVHSDRQDAYERPVDEVYKPEYELHGYQRPSNYFEEREPQHEKTSFPRNFESLDLSDNQIVLDSITINRESPDGREIPFLDVVAVDNKVGDDPDSRVKVMAFNKENGAVEVINVGHEDSNHDIESLADPGSGDGEERSLDSRSFPLDSNSWSFMTRIQSQERRKFKRCLTPRNETGNCMPVQMCSVPNVGNTVEELLKNVCIIDEVFIGICCPEFPVETVRVDWGQFGRPDTEPLLDKVESSEITECGKLPSTIGDNDSWPWMAPLISTTSDKVFCGGALISESYVLTAAHCTSKIPRNQILVRLQNSPQSSTEFAVIEIKRHAQYNPRTMQNDIALLKLSRKVPLGQFRKLVCLPNNDVVDYVGDTAVLLRWQGIAERGTVESLSVIANHECQNRLGALVGGSVLCTETRNDEAMCNADSGAPFVIEKDGRFQIIGTLTWNRNDCDGNFPTVFTRVSSYLKWIQTHTK